MTREKLPGRRRAETITFVHLELSQVPRARDLSPEEDRRRRMVDAALELVRDRL